MHISKKSTLSRLLLAAARQGLKLIVTYQTWVKTVCDRYPICPTLRFVSCAIFESHSAPSCSLLITPQSLNSSRTVVCHPIVYYARICSGSWRTNRWQLWPTNFEPTWHLDSKMVGQSFPTWSPQMQLQIRGYFILGFQTTVRMELSDWGPIDKPQLGAL